MKVSYKWLKTMVDVPADITAFTNALDLTGTAVEDVQASGVRLDGIVVGHILTREAHPNADTLWVTTVDVGAHNLGADGTPAPLQIVCGAQNFVAGHRVPVALVGTVMPDGTEIKKAKLRGVESRGMNCSARELGLGEDHAGLLILSPDAPVGVPIAQYLGQGDTIIDLEITPNRPDCMSMLGIAREVGAVYNKPYALEDLSSFGTPPVDVSPSNRRGELCSPVAESSSQPGRPQVTPTIEPPASAGDLVRVTIDDPERCPRYTARVVKGVRVGPSPAWLVERVAAAGARSINNIVDVTNYIMFELGQPLHAFDLDTLTKDAAGKAHIVVRAATSGEHFTTLDGIKRTLDTDSTVIVDGNAAAGAGTTIALAGVMGGLHSEVTETTVDILLEAATFSPSHTSRTSRKLQLFSEASARYERGVDGATCDAFSARAAALMVEVAGGEVCEGVVDAYPAPVVPVPLDFRVERFQSFIGAPIPTDDITTILASLGCAVSSQPAAAAAAGDEAGDAAGDEGARENPEHEAPELLPSTTLRVTPPSYRPDLTREVDLYEEVLRIWGMERIPATLPGGRGRIGERTLEQQRVARIGEALRAGGLNQTMTYAFGALGDNDLLGMPFDERQQAAELINPLNSEQRVMRRSILPGLLRSVAYNQNRGVANVHLYELGTVFFAAEGRKQPKERQLVAGVLAGRWFDAGWNTPAEPLDFFDGKGVVEGLLRELNIPKLRFKALDAATAPWLQSGRGAAVMAGSQQLGWLGEVHPSVCAAFEATAPLVAFELEVKALLAAAQPARPYTDVPQYPAIERDVAVVVDESVTAERIEQVVASAAGKLLHTVRLFDVYRDAEKIGAGKKSLALTLTYRAADRTLTSEEVDILHQKVIRKVTAAVGAEVR